MPHRPHCYMHRNNTCTYGQGGQVYLLDAPDGEAFILQSAGDLTRFRAGLRGRFLALPSSAQQESR